MSAYLKSIIAAIGALAMIVTTAVSDQAISFDEANGIWLAMLGVLTAVGVYSVRNRPPR